MRCSRPAASSRRAPAAYRALGREPPRPRRSQNATHGPRPETSGPRGRLRSLAAGEILHAAARKLHLVRGTEDFLPGRLVNRNAIAGPLRAQLALGLAGDAHMVEAGRGPRLAQPVEEESRLALEGRLGA